MIAICFGDSEWGVIKHALGNKHVFCSYSGLDLGRLADPDFLSARRKWFDEFFNCSKMKKMFFFINEVKNFKKIYNLIKKGETPRIWVASCPSSKCGFFQLIYAIHDFAKEIYVVEMSKDTENSINKRDRNWGESSPSMVLESLKSQRKLSAEEIKQLSECWEKLVNENAELRVNENNQIKSVSIDYFDDEIYSLSPEGEQKVIQIMAEVISRSNHFMSDSFVVDRIKTMMLKGKYEVIKTGTDYYRDTVLKKTMSL